jgi:hypothetical protein
VSDLYTILRRSRHLCSTPGFQSWIIRHRIPRIVGLGYVFTFITHLVGEAGFEPAMRQPLGLCFAISGLPSSITWPTAFPVKRQSPFRGLNRHYFTTISNSSDNSTSTLILLLSLVNFSLI